MDLRVYQCKPCPVGIFCNSPGITTANMMLKEGYYYYYDADQDLHDAVECATEIACPGGSLDASSKEALRSTRSCGTNRQGLLCAQCVEDTYEWGARCLQCSESTYIPVFIGIVAVTWLYVVVIHHISNPEDLREGRDAGTKVFLFFISTVRLVTGGEVRWLSWLGVFDFEAEKATGGRVCVLPLDPMAKMLFEVVLPLLGIVLLGLTAGIHSLYRKLRGHPTAGKAYFRTLCALAIFSYTAISNVTLNYLDCQEIGDTGIELVRSAQAVDCNSQSYKSLRVFMYMLVVFPIALLPLMIMAFLHHYHKQGTLQSKVASFGILFETYDKEFFWFEGFALLRRSLFVMTLTVLPVDELAKSQIFVALTVVFGTVHSATLPYVLGKDDFFEKCSLLCLLFITLFQTGRREEDVLSDPVQAFITVLVLLMVLLFIFLTLYSQPTLQLDRKLPQAVVAFLAKRGIKPLVFVKTEAAKEKEVEKKDPGTMAVLPSAVSVGAPAIDLEMVEDEAGGAGEKELELVTVGTSAPPPLHIDAISSPSQKMREEEGTEVGTETEPGMEAEAEA
jgi:hypothetical protein